MCRYALGIYYVGEQDHKFYDGKETKLIGCMTYGYPVGRSAVQSIIPTLEKEEVLELTRLYIDDGYGKNIESLSMGKSFKWLKQNTDIKALISYADPKEGHAGTIYQATNWLYQGNSIRPNDTYSFKLKPEPLRYKPLTYNAPKKQNKKLTYATKTLNRSRGVTVTSTANATATGTASNDVYGTNLNDEIITLGVPDVYAVRAVYESRDTTTALPPALTVE